MDDLMEVISALSLAFMVFMGSLFIADMCFGLVIYVIGG